jgi:hypothetical protein
MFAGHLHGRLRVGEAQRLAGVEVGKVDGLGRIRVGLGPVLAHFENQPRIPLETILLDRASHTQQQLCALFHGSAAPALVGLQRGSHRQGNFFGARLLECANHFRRRAGVDRDDLLLGLATLPANDQVILAAQLRPHFVDCIAHCARVVWP